MKPARRLVFVNRFFHPDRSATSQIASDLAFRLSSRGWDVEAITSRHGYDDVMPGVPPDIVGGVRIVRVWSTRFGRTLLGRAVDYATFGLTAFTALARRARPGTVVVALTDPPLLSVVAAMASLLRGAALVNWCHDLFPDAAAALGLRVPRVLWRLRDWSLGRAEANVTVSESMAAHVRGSVAISNWAPGELVPVPRDRNPLRRAWALGDAFVVGYTGNLGRAHEVATIVRTMARLRWARFVFVGGGARLDDVRAAALPNAEFHPRQPIHLLSETLSVADVHLVSLLPALEGLVLPSKFYGALAVGRPIIFIGWRGAEIARLIQEHRCGVAVDVGDVDALAATIRRFAEEPALVAEMGDRSRQLYRERFTVERALEAWERVLTKASTRDSSLTLAVDGRSAERGDGRWWRQGGR